MNSTPESNNSPEAQHFDIIVIGGGTFGAAIAQKLFFNDDECKHRILVLEGGPFFVPEHIQNLAAGIKPPGDKLIDKEGGEFDRTIKNLRASGHRDGAPYSDVWGLPWHSSIGFSGLSYNIGGRSVHWGGWSPRPLDEEMPTFSSSVSQCWPAAVVNELNTQYFEEAAHLMGVDEPNDCISGELHGAMRQQLAAGIADGHVKHAIPLDELPPTTLNLEIEASEELMEELKLEAPLAIQSNSRRSGVFPMRKFSTVPLIAAATRQAYKESNGNDVNKRLMLVPQCRVNRLVYQDGRVTEVHTNLRKEPIKIPSGGQVIIAVGAIESIRLALLSFKGMPNYDNLGKNLMTHIRSNLEFRISRKSLEPLLSSKITELQSSALIVKCKATRDDGSVIGYFHQQIMASGLGSITESSEEDMFRVMPDFDKLEHFKSVDDDSVIISICGVGAMESGNLGSYVQLDKERDEYGQHRAFVSIAANAIDNELHDKMDENAQDIVAVFANGKTVDPSPSSNSPSGGKFRREGLGSTHHECGGLAMGDDSDTSVTNSDARFWHVDNAYAIGPALFPTMGSPNPVLTGIALCRRLADHLVPPSK